MHLDRWVVVHDAIEEWYRTTEPDEVAVRPIVDRIMGWMDPVQRQIAEELFASYRRLLPKNPDEEVDLDPPWSEVFDEDTKASISVATQFALATGTETELVKLKTGRGVSDEEKAVLLEGAQDTSTRFLEVHLRNGDVDELEMAPESRRIAIERLFAIPGRVREVGSKGTNPGPHCFACSRPARCGQYPTLDGRQLGSRTRAVIVTKKWLARLNRCERQVAWARLYGIPKADGDEETGWRLVSGNTFHEAAAAAELADDPERVIADIAETLQNSERADLLLLWDLHTQLVSAEPKPVTVRKTNYGVGVTVIAPGIYVDGNDQEHSDSPVGVVFVAFTDAVGREQDGTPAVVEHRTGSYGSLALEPEMYALGAHLLTGDAPVAVHTHQLRATDGPKCERIEFGAPELADAASQLQAAADTVAAWHPTDSLSAPFNVGEWCQWCPFESRCVNYRE